MKNTNFIKVEIKIAKNLIPNRISVALSSYGLNEFYSAFKYLKMVLIDLFEKDTIFVRNIKETYIKIANIYGNTTKTVVNAVNEFLKKLPKNFFDGCVLQNLKKMNTYHKTFFIAKAVLNDIHCY